MDTSTLISRIVRVLRFDASVYREVAGDASALPQALLIVAATAVFTGVGNLGNIFVTGEVVSTLILAVFAAVGSLIGYALYAGIAAFVAKTFFQGKTDFQEMARTVGFAYTWNGLAVFGIIPCLGGLVAFVGSLVAIVAGVIALRESAEFELTQAVITAVIAGVASAAAYACATLVIAAPIIAMLGLAAGAGQ